MVATVALASCAPGALVSPPEGAPLLFEVAAEGVQIYTCRGTEGSAWYFKAPEANLFDNQGRQIGIHFAGPTWKMYDGSAVIGEVIGGPYVPRADAIPWLLLRVKSHEGNGSLTAVDSIRRTETKGGVAPSSGCDVAHWNTEVRIRYSAVYQFYGVAK